MSSDTQAASIQLEFHDHSLLPLLFGEHDRNLTRIEQKLKVSLAPFGNTLRISGDEASAPAAQKTLEALYRRLEKTRSKGREPWALELGDIDAAMAWVASDVGADEVGRFAAGEGVLETWKRPVHSRSANQQLYLKALLEHELVFGLGPAGTGKTYLAVAAAAAMLKARRVDRIILSRPAVEAGERLGFLPGDMKDKVDPYLRPLYDALYDMMPGEQVERRLAAGEIEVAPLAFMRGRTLANAFVILDEAQNTTPTQMKMFLTRLGENSRMAITGDLSQVDLPLGNKSGLRDAVEALDSVEGVSFIEFTAADVVRHPLVTRIVHAYNRREGSLLPTPVSR
ncbi:PhoH family protein [Thalassobaculum sp.]|uniref:PhoH family protein n=1 Tax=Thalassobaculum sp. TaxID=2022740 RepID=UPI0032EF1CA4